MDIRQLEAFVYTVKYQSFSLAAQKLYISQPTVSAHIRSLEEEFHTQLLKRTTKSLSLTPAGTKLYSYATEILTLQQKAIVELANETKPQLRIGASSVPSLYFLPVWLPREAPPFLSGFMAIRWITRQSTEHSPCARRRPTRTTAGFTRQAILFPRRSRTLSARQPASRTAVCRRQTA